MSHVLRSVLVTCLLLVGVGNPRDIHADEPEVLAEFGCTVEPRVPAIYGREIHSPVRLECETSFEGRLIVTELQQRRADGSYRNVPGTRLMLEAYDPVMGDAEFTEHSASGWRMECRSIDGVQEFRTAVKIRAEGEATPRIYSDPVALSQDCFGDEFEPVISEEDAQLAVACQTASLSDDALAESLARSLDLAAMPTTPQNVEILEEALRIGVLPESELPVGSRVDSETILALSELESEFADCLNAGELRRAATLLIGEFQREFLESAAVEGLPGNRFEHPYPFPIDFRVTAAVRDVRLIEDGRIGAIVDWKNVTTGVQESNFRVYEQVDGEWRIAAEISIYG